MTSHCVLCPSQGDLLLFAAGTEATVNHGLDRVRQYIAKQLNLADPKQHALLWITDFPMFEWNEEEQRHQALHHPFTAPNQQQSGQNGADLSRSTALAYDLVYNGVEIGGKLRFLLAEYHMLFVGVNHTGSYRLCLAFGWHAKRASVSAADLCLQHKCANLTFVTPRQPNLVKAFLQETMSCQSCTYHDNILLTVLCYQHCCSCVLQLD